jgi:hypothetical protein
MTARFTLPAAPCSSLLVNVAVQPRRVPLLLPVLLLLATLAPKSCDAELPKAITVSPIAILPGQTTTVSVNGLNLNNATELWTNLDAVIQKPQADDSEILPIESACADDKVAPVGTLIVEAEDFNRGQFQKSGAVINNGNFTPNYAEWDFDIPNDGQYVLELKYASGGSRPVKLLLNGNLLTENAAAGVTGGFADSDARWMVECVLSLKKGMNTVRLERPGGTPHFDKLALVPTDRPATGFSSVTATDRVAPFELIVAPGTPVGIRALRVATAEGISNQLLFMVDDLPTVKENREQTGSANAQAFELPIAIEGYCDVGHADCYRIHVEAGEEVSFEVVATRLGSKLDPLIRLLSADRKELVFIDDSPGLAGDCCLRYRFEAAGDYIVEIEDALMGGASGHWYRLRVGDFPLVSATLPAVVQQQQPTSVHFSGPAVSGLAAVDLPPAGAASSQFVSIAFADRIGSGYTEVRTSQLPQVVVQASGDGDVAAIPCGISGVLAAAGDVHTCRFAATKGQRLLFRDVGRVNGGSAIMTMSIRDNDHKTLAEIRKADAAGRELKWTPPNDGEYQLVLTDLTSRGGSAFDYYVEIQRDENTFTLSVEQDSVILPQNGYSLLKVTADRKGYDGPINLAVNGLGPDVRLKNEVIADKAKETRLKIYSPPSDLPGQTRTIEIVGTATVGETVIQRTATTIVAMRKANPRTPFPPPSLDGSIATVASPEFPDFFSLSVDDNVVLFPRFIGEVYFTVRVADRAEGFKDPVNITVEGLPEGFRASGGENPVGGSNNSEYRFQLNGPTEVGFIEAPIRIIAEATFKGQAKEVTVATSPLRIVEPLIISVHPDAPLTAGTTGTLKLAARRFVARDGGDRKQIDVEFSSVPKGVSLPSSATIPAGKNDVAVSIKLDSGVDFKTLSEIIVTARTVVGEREIIVNSSIAPEVLQ